MRLRISKLKGITNWVINNPKKTIIFTIIVTLSFCFFIPRISFKSDMKDMVPLNDPVIKDFEKVINEFGSQDFLTVALYSNNIFNLDTLKKINKIFEEFSNLQGVERVTTPLNIDLIEGSEGLISITPIVEKVPEKEEEIEKFKEKILSSSQGKSFVAKNKKAALILITLEPGIAATEKADELIEKILVIIHQNETPEEIYLAGDAYITHYAKNIMGRDLYFLFTLIVLVIIGFLYFCFRSRIGILIPIMTVFMSIIWMIGFMACMGYPFSIISIIAPVILVAIGSAYGIHIVNKYYEEIRKGLRGKEAALNTMSEMNSPTIMAALTTVAGFLTLNTSFVVPIKQFGTSAAFGVLSAMLLSLTFIPAVLTLEKKIPRYIKRQRSPSILDSFLKKIGFSIAGHPKTVIVIFSLIICFFLLGISRINTNADLMRYLGKNSPPVQSINKVEDNFGGTSRLLIEIDAKGKDEIKEPAVLKKILEIEKYLDSLKYTGDSSSLTDIIRQINQVLHNGDENYYAIPETRRAVAQELLLFTMQGGSGIDSMVSYNFEKALISTQLDNIGALELKDTINKIEDYLKKDSDLGKFNVKLVGMPKITLHLMNRILNSQLSSLFYSIIIVLIIVSLIFVSFKIGLICILPLLLTIGINFGIMGYFGIPLDVATATISSIAIGIGIDYAIHFISRYRREMKNKKDKREALIITTKTAGRGIFFNAITLILGFGVLLLSSFHAIFVFGYLICLIMAISSVASLTVIPAILKLTKIRIN